MVFAADGVLCVRDGSSVDCPSRVLAVDRKHSVEAAWLPSSGGRPDACGQLESGIRHHSGYSVLVLRTGTPYIEVNLSLPDVNSPLTGASMAMLH